MPRTVIMRDVPPDKLAQVINDATLEGATATTIPQADGNYTVTAIYPDDATARPARN